MDENLGQQGIHEAESLYRIRHGLAHVMAQAVLELRPGSKLGFGPPIEGGFYYDFILTSPITEEDFPEIEKRMKHLIRKRQPFEQEELDRDPAMARLEQMGEPYKKEYAEELFSKHGIKKLSFYKMGAFLDMCEGPHVANTGELPEGSFKIRSVAGAYWRGDSKREMMTRIYAWSFASRTELEAYVKGWKEAQERDHKKIGKALDFYSFDDEIGKGLPLWLPDGTVIRDELEKLAREFEFHGGYQRVATPHLAKVDLYYKTGHLPYYATHMYPFMEIHERHETAEGNLTDVKETYALRPMNCPHHIEIYKSEPHSYRDLPLRLAEFGTVYRYEQSGELNGLTRVRGFTVDDSHLFVTLDQLQEEFIGVVSLIQHVFNTMGFHDFRARLGTNDPDSDKSAGTPEMWAQGIKAIQQAADKVGMNYKVEVGEAAFYGPKLDFIFRDVLKREWQLGTVQVDFLLPQRFDLEYTGEDGQKHRPVMIHRAPFGSMERFIGILIEHFNGAFPLWLSPVQAMVVPITERHNEYARQVANELRVAGLRVQVDESDDRMNKKIRNAQLLKIPYMLVIGDKEAEAHAVAVRTRTGEDRGAVSVAEFKAQALTLITTKSMEL